MSRMKHLPGAVLIVSGLAVAAGGCLDNTGLLIILQNQQPLIDTTTNQCSPGMTASVTTVGSGVLDLEVGTDDVSYTAYPLVQNTLPARATSPGALEPNTVAIDGVKVTIVPPPGLVVNWPAGCPASFPWPDSESLLPGNTQGLTTQVIRPCHAKLIHDLFAAGELPSDLSQQVVFNVELRAYGRVSGSEITSDVFRFSVRTCIGCLQTGFSDVAQFNFPNRPSCGISPKPNKYHGNPCHLGQDYGPLLCCTDDMSKIVCPAPDM
jgi:hypothetical protein